MENLLEANERTLVMFEAICLGLSDCLALVHSDIKQMTEQRNRLAQLEQQNLLQNKCLSSQNLLNSDQHCTRDLVSKNKRKKLVGEKEKHHDDDDDPHHLAGLKLLDKRLAESFSQALSLNDLQKSSIAAKQNANQNRPSIFQVLLGKTKKIDKRHQPVESDETSIDDINKQTRMAMQYAKQLEANLFKVEDLKNKYELHLKMGLVCRSIARAYVPNSSSPNSLARHRHFSSLVINDTSSMGTHSSMSSLNLSTWSSSSRTKNKRREQAIQEQQNRLNNNASNSLSKSHANLNSGSHLSLKGLKNKSSNGKTTIKEFIENIEKIETELESYMGSFLLAIRDIQGFARVCHGDVFEISIKYGDTQKFKTRISVLKDNSQKCDNRQTIFKARIADVLAIKAYECKGLGKRVLLGHKLCETRDLFTARSQLMTISLNQTGSIKLNLFVTWNPLHLAPSLLGADISHISLPPTPASSSTLSSLSSGPSIKGASQLNSSYQSVDSTYGYYIPPPDYVTNG